MRYLDHYITLAELFKFPGEDYPEKVKKVQKLLDKHYPEAGSTMQDFTSFINQASSKQIEELFIRTFDVQALCCIDVGYVLFGEDYKRGKLMANLNKEHHQAGNDCEGELADHLPNVLTLLPKLEDQEVVEELVGYVLIPAVDKMVRSFQSKNVKAKEKVYLKHHKTLIEQPEEYALIYKNPLMMLSQVIKEDFSDISQHKEEAEADTDFIESVNKEMKIEK